MANRQKTNRLKSRKRRFYLRAGFWATCVCLALLAAVAGYFFVESYTRPYRERAATYDLDRINDLEVPSLIVDRNGKEIGRIFVQNRSIIPIEEVPDIFIDALRAGEDSRFLSHSGVDYIGIIRAAKLNFEAGGVNQGASTITQQLARNAYNLRQEALERKESGIERKLVEAFLAMRIEKRYSKRQILDFYLNRIYFGSGFYGIRSASLGYFGKEPKDLNLEECASLVTLIKNPTGRSPLNNPKANQDGRNYVLMRMKEERMISASDMARHQAAPLRLNPKPLRRGTSHLYERVAEAVGEALGEDALAAGGFTIHTTILAEAQTAAQESLLESLATAEAQPGFTRQKYHEYSRESGRPPEYLQGAVLMVDHDTGEVLAHVGGRDYAQEQFDFVESGRRPLGTAFFPFIYAAGLGAGMSPATLVEDEPMDNRAVMVGGREGILGEWGAEVANPVYEGEIPIRQALEKSKIAATVRFGGQVGLKRVVDTAVSFGLPIGNAELLPRICVGWEAVPMRQAVRAMSTFAKGGNAGPQNLFYLDRVEDPSGRMIYRRPRMPEPVRRVTDDATAWQIHSMMAGSLTTGSAAGALDGLIERPFHGAGKGGSTHDFSDTWFLGYNKRITCGVWAGFLQGSGDAIYPGAFSRDITLPVWQAVMNAAAPSFGGDAFVQPPSVVEVQVCKFSGHQPTQFCQEIVEDLQTGQAHTRSTAITEYFRKGTESLAFCTLHSGVLGEAIDPTLALSALPALEAVPVRPKAPVLIGDDPYHAEIPSFIATSGEAGFIRRRTNVLDSLDLGDVEEGIPLRRPGRLQIYLD
jgi:membrane peptidoglycan carboxypeptidase